MNMGEIYLALQQGVIDGQENPFGNIRKKSWFEVQKFISKSRHVYTPITFVMNLKRYESLTEKQKEKAKKEQKTRAEQSRAARRSGKSMKTEGKVSKSTSKTKESRSSKKIATIKKRTRS